MKKEGLMKDYNYKLTSYNASFSLKEYSNRYRAKSATESSKQDIGCFYAPAFQRNSVWNDKAKSKLIETFLLKLPVPPVFLYKNKNAQHEIIDGYQRIKTIHDFIEDNYVLKHLNSKYNGLTFSQLSDIEKSDFETKMLNCIIIEDIDERPNREALYEIFARLNSGGTNLNNMEIRRAIGWGKFLSQIEEVSTTDEWEKIWGNKKAKRYEDIELILRILAFSEKKYDKPMKEFLNDYLEENKDRDKNVLINKFQQALKRILNDFKETKPFHRNGARRTNFALSDSILPVLINHPKIENLKIKLEKLIFPFQENKELTPSEMELCKEFQDICFKGQGSISKNAVNTRQKIAEEILLA